MDLFLAKAEGPDVSDSNLLLVLICAGLIMAAVVLASVPAFIARRRNHGRSETVLAMAVLWALLTAGTLVHASVVQMQWSKEYQLRIQSGYLDPQDMSNAPAKPWRTWTVLGTLYCVLVIGAFAGPTASHEPRRNGE